MAESLSHPSSSEKNELGRLSHIPVLCQFFFAVQSGVKCGGMPEGYIIFEGNIDQQASLRLVNAIAQLTKPGIQKIIILFSSLGGSIYDGFLLATIIQNSKTPIAIHATNHIDSIANVIFLSAKERTAEAHAKFFLHGASVTGNLNLDEKGLKEKLLETKIQNGRIALFVAANSSVKIKKVQSMMEVGTTLSAQEALKHKILHSIEHKEIPLSAERVDVIYVN